MGEGSGEKSLFPRLERAGFTLIELLVVIVILAVLMAIAIPSYLNQQKKAKDSAVKQMLTTAYRSAWATATSNGGTYPGNPLLASEIHADQPQIFVSRGLDYTAARNLPDNQAVIDIDNTAGNTLRLYANSANNVVWELDASASSGPVIGPATTVPGDPTSSSSPSISGTVGQGSVISATQGSWTGGSSISYTYQWVRCDASGRACVDIPGATSSTYTVQAADASSTLRVVVTATDANAFNTSTSAPTKIIGASAGPAAPVNSTPPSITGSAYQYQAFSATSGSWTGTPTTYNYQWQRCNPTCVDIAGANTSSYTAAAADVGYTLRVGVIADNGSTSAPNYSAQSGTIIGGYPAAALQDNPIAFWRMGDNGAGAMVDSSLGTTHDGTYVNSPTPVAAPGLLSSGSNGAMNFNGTSQYGTVPYAAAINPNVLTGFSVEAIVKPASTPTPSEDWYIIESVSPTTFGGFSLKQVGGRFYFSVVSNTTTVIDLNSTTWLTAGNTYDVVATFDGTTMRMYVNGVQDHAPYTPGYVSYKSNGNGPTLIGTDTEFNNGVPKWWWNGTIDEVAVYNQVLTPAQIAAHNAAR